MHRYRDAIVGRYPNVFVSSKGAVATVKRQHIIILLVFNIFLSQNFISNLNYFLVTRYDATHISATISTLRKENTNGNKGKNDNNIIYWRK